VYFVTRKLSVLCVFRARFSDVDFVLLLDDAGQPVASNGRPWPDFYIDT
jgi:hypothetical protein